MKEYKKMQFSQESGWESFVVLLKKKKIKQKKGKKRKRSW